MKGVHSILEGTHVEGLLDDEDPSRTGVGDPPALGVSARQHATHERVIFEGRFDVTNFLTDLNDAAEVGGEDLAESREESGIEVAHDAGVVVALRLRTLVEATTPRDGEKSQRQRGERVVVRGRGRPS
jgi:hypothetical protein